MATNPYVKAAVITLLLAAAGFVVITQIDAARERELSATIDSLLFDSDSSRLMYLYAQAIGTNDPEFCKFLNATMAAQITKTGGIANKIAEYEKASLFSQEYESIKRRYYVNNAELYLYAYSAKKYCDPAPIAPVLFFYKVGSDCPDCRAQGTVLDTVVDACPNVRVFAFPIDTNYSFINLFAERYSVSSAPAIVLPDGTVLAGLKSREEIVAGLRAAGVNLCLR